MHKVRMRQVQTKRDVESELIENMGHSLSCIVMGVLEAKTDEFEGKERKLNNFYFYVQDEKKKWHLDTKDTSEIIDEAKGKRSHIYESCQRVPMSQLLYLAKGRRYSANPNLKKYLQAGYCIIGVWMDTVLQEHYRMSVAARKEIFMHMNNWIDSYQKGYQSNEGVFELFREDLNYDLQKGERIVSGV